MTTADPMTQYSQLRDRLLADSSCSFWLKEAIGKLENRDPCDAVGDAELLLRLSNLRLDGVMGVADVGQASSPPLCDSWTERDRHVRQV